MRRGQERGELRRDVDARLATAILFSTSFAILSGSVFRADETTPEHVRTQFLTAYLHGLVAEPTAEQAARAAAKKEA